MYDMTPLKSCDSTVFLIFCAMHEQVWSGTIKDDSQKEILTRLQAKSGSVSDHWTI